jgi:hypothetical protein
MVVSLLVCFIAGLVVNNFYYSYSIFVFNSVLVDAHDGNVAFYNVFILNGVEIW